jgi:hypothetical protein
MTGRQNAVEGEGVVNERKEGMLCRTRGCLTVIYMLMTGKQKVL